MSFVLALESFMSANTAWIQSSTILLFNSTWLLYISLLLSKAAIDRENNYLHTGCVICIWTIFESGCGIQVSQATPTKFSMLFKHNYGKLSWKFGDHSLNFSFVHGPSWLRILESIHRYGVIFTFCKKISKGHCEAMLDVKKYTLLTFKGICMNFSLELIFFYFKSPSDLKTAS